MKSFSYERFLPVFFGISACSWVPHWACHYYRLETGTSFVVGSWSFSPTDSAISLAVYGLLILINLLSISIIRLRFPISLATGLLHIIIGSVHIARLLSPFTFEVFGYPWSYGASLREVVVVLSFGVVCLMVAAKLFKSRFHTGDLARTP